MTDGYGANICTFVQSQSYSFIVLSIFLVYDLLFIIYRLLFIFIVYYYVYLAAYGIKKCPSALIIIIALLTEIVLPRLSTEIVLLLIVFMLLFIIVIVIVIVIVIQVPFGALGGRRTRASRTRHIRMQVLCHTYYLYVFPVAVVLVERLLYAGQVATWPLEICYRAL